MSDYLTIPEVAALARCGHKAVRRAIHNQHLPAWQPGRRLLIREEDARAWIESHPARTPSQTIRRLPRRPSTQPAGTGSVADLKAIEERMASR